MLLKVESVNEIAGFTRIPSSKPETQRAILAALLAKGTSYIYNDLRCSETTAMKNACRHFGAKINEKDGYLEIEGVGKDLVSDKKIIDSLGSGLVFRVFTAISCFSKTPTIITGDKTLRGRIMSPLFEALKDLGAQINCIAEDGNAPIVNWGGDFYGGQCRIPGNLSSQFITSILIAAPLAKTPTTIFIDGEILSVSYIRQTIDTMTKSGIIIEVDDNYSNIKVYPGEYKAISHHIVGDFTSSSYLVVAASIFKGRTILANMNSRSLQGERAIIDIISTLGIKAEFDDCQNILKLESNGLSKGDYIFDTTDCPNIVPTLAVLGAYVPGSFKVVGGAITRLHKSPRIKAIITELKKLGVDIKAIFKDGAYDGFEIKGKSIYDGDVKLSSWGDHRIFMSLFVASLRCKKPNNLEGYEDVHCSFPEFFDEFIGLGVTFYEIDDEDIIEEQKLSATNYKG